MRIEMSDGPAKTACLSYRACTGLGVKLARLMLEEGYAEVLGPCPPINSGIRCALVNPRTIIPA